MTATVAAPVAKTPKAKPAKRTISGRTAVDVAVVTILSVIGIIGFATAFQTLGWLIAGVAGLAVGIVAAIASHFLRLGAIPTFILAVLGFFLFGSAAALPELALFRVVPTIDSLTNLAVGTVFGWADILTLRPPVELPDYVTAVPYFSAWAVGLVSTVLAVRWLPLRKRTAWRSAMLVVGPFLLYVAGVLLGTDEPVFAAIRGITFAALALVWLGWRRGVGPGVTVKSDRSLLRKKLVGTALVVAAAVAVGVIVGTAIAPLPDNRFVLREQVQPPFEPLVYPSPFAAFRKYTKTLEETKLFTVTGLQPGQTVRLATLDTYDGILWGVAGSTVATDGSGSFSLVSKDIPKPPLVTPADTDSDVSISIEDYSDVWMPSVGYATSLAFTDSSSRSQAEALRYNPATGTAVLTSGLKSGDSYELTAETQKEYKTEDLADVPVANLQLTPVSNIPDVVTAKAAELAGDAESPIEKLRAIETALKTSGYLSHGAADDAVASRAGQGADRMVELFTRTQLIGDQEQYASAFALMARSFNYPARVVMGFAPEVGAGQGAVTVLGGDVTAWVEVAFEGVGWVPFYPTPDDTDIPQDQNPKPQSEPQPQVRQPPRTQTDENDLVAGVEVNDSDDKDNGLFEIPGWAIAIGLALLIPAALIFIPLFLIGAAKARRAARRRNAKKGDVAAAGAWDELVDRFSELGYSVPANLTRGGTARTLDGQLPEKVGLATIATRADQAVFSGQEIAKTQSEEVWTEAMAAVRVAQAAVTRGQRLLSRYRVSALASWASRFIAAASVPSIRRPGSKQ